MIAMPKPWVWSSLVAALVLTLVLVPAGPAPAHRSDTPHQLVLTSIAVEGDSLSVVLWVERPTPIVAAEFRAHFAEDRRAAADQDARFRRAQWAALAEALHVRVNGEPLDVDLTPLPLPNNGRGNETRFVYGVGATVAVRTDRLVVEFDNQALLDQDHVFLSVYADAIRPWRVVEDSSRQLLADAERVPVELAPRATWSHDERLRQGRVVFER